MSEIAENAPPRQFRVNAPYIQYRKKNIEGRRFGTRVSPWMIQGAYQNAVISSELIHPDDLAHLERKTLTPALGGGSILTEIPA